MSCKWAQKYKNNGNELVKQFQNLNFNLNLCDLSCVSSIKNKCEICHTKNAMRTNSMKKTVEKKTYEEQIRHKINWQKKTQSAKILLTHIFSRLKKDKMRHFRILRKKRTTHREHTVYLWFHNISVRIHCNLSTRIGQSIKWLDTFIGWLDGWMVSTHCVDVCHAKMLLNVLC